jgi:thiol-disulfide isomerase/thioredoxin
MLRNSYARTSLITFIVLGIILLMVFIYYQRITEQNDVDALAVSPAAQSLAGEGLYTDLAGNQVSLSDYVGQNIIAFAWASWCPACVEQLKLLSAVAEGQESVVVLAINRGESRATARDFLAFYNLDTSVELILDPNDHFFQSVNGFSMPETVVFNRAGNIVHHERGPITDSELTYIINNLD